MLSTESVSTNALTADQAISDKVVDAVASHALDLATDVAVPAAKFAAIRFVRRQGRTLAIGVVVLVIGGMVFKKLRGRKADTNTDAAEAIDDIPTVEDRTP